MSDIICVTNSRLCHGDFLQRIEQIAACRPGGVIVREKDLNSREYSRLAGQIIDICRQYDVPCILHSFVKEAVDLGADRIHLPMHLLRELKEDKRRFKVIGASVHSAEEAREAQALGAAYLTAGHIFDTDCKKGLPGRGPGFLSEVCRSVDIPVYAIGGIDADNIGDVRRAGAAGACIMSGLMQCGDVRKFIDAFEEKL